MPSDDGTGPAQDAAVYQIGELSTLNMALNMRSDRVSGGLLPFVINLRDLNARLGYAVNQEVFLGDVTPT